MLGGKGVGSQGDGSAQLLLEGPSERDAARAILEEQGFRTLDLTLDKG